jgi:acyl dehydratase
MADASKTGAVYDFEWLVERGKIRELALAIGDRNPVYFDPEAARTEGYGDLAAPPTFSAVPLMWTGVLFKAFKDLGMVHERIVHAEQSYDYLGSIQAGDTLRGRMRVVSVTHREGRSGGLDFVLFETALANQHGHPVLKEEMLVVERL